MRSLPLIIAAAALVACSPTPRIALARPTASPAGDEPRVELPPHAVQGSLVTGRTVPGARVTIGDRAVRVAPDGTFVFGVPRDAQRALRIEVRAASGALRANEVDIVRRDWPVERVDGVPPSSVAPPPAIAARIRAEQARVDAARRRDGPHVDFAGPFLRPVAGRVSGRFGSRRIYNGTPGAPHSGMDIAAAAGTAVRAPAGGIVTFADPALYLTGGTMVIDHGHGVSSNFLHLSRIDVRVGERVERGQVVAAVGATGRATGPHLHWGMNWFDVRIDPEQVLGASR